MAGEKLIEAITFKCTEEQKRELDGVAEIYPREHPGLNGGLVADDEPMPLCRRECCPDQVRQDQSRVAVDGLQQLSIAELGGAACGVKVRPVFHAGPRQVLDLDQPACPTPGA